MEVWGDLGVLSIIDQAQCRRRGEGMWWLDSVGIVLCMIIRYIMFSYVTHVCVEHVYMYVLHHLPAFFV